MKKLFNLFRRNNQAAASFSCVGFAYSLFTLDGQHVQTVSIPFDVMEPRKGAQYIFNHIHKINEANGGQYLFKVLADCRDNEGRHLFADFYKWRDLVFSGVYTNTGASFEEK